MKGEEEREETNPREDRRGGKQGIPGSRVARFRPDDEQACEEIISRLNEERRGKTKKTTHESGSELHNRFLFERTRNVNLRSVPVEHGRKGAMNSP